jgi:TPR repeat protein
MRLILSFFVCQAGASGLGADPPQAVEYYTQASELHGRGDAQYKLGFLYGSNYGNAMGGLEGDGHQGSVSWCSLRREREN